MSFDCMSKMSEAFESKRAAKIDKLVFTDALELLAFPVEMFQEKKSVILFLPVIFGAYPKDSKNSTTLSVINLFHLRMGMANAECQGNTFSVYLLENYLGYHLPLIKK